MQLIEGNTILIEKQTNAPTIYAILTITEGLQTEITANYSNSNYTG